MNHYFSAEDIEYLIGCHFGSNPNNVMDYQPGVLGHPYPPCEEDYAGHAAELLTCDCFDGQHPYDDYFDVVRFPEFCELLDHVALSWDAHGEFVRNIPFHDGMGNRDRCIEILQLIDADVMKIAASTLYVLRRDGVDPDGLFETVRAYNANPEYLEWKIDQDFPVKED